MTDWLTPDERHYIRAAIDSIPRVYPDEVARLLDHAAEADRRIAERDDVIRELADAANAMLDAPRNRCAPSAELMERTLGRVDALGGDHG